MKGMERSFAVEGLNLERYIRQAAEMNLAMKSVKRRGRKITAKAQEDTLPLLQSLAEQGGWRFSAGKRQGAGQVVDAVRHRWQLAVMVLLIIGLLLFSTQIVWHIDVEHAGIYAADLSIYLQQVGIHPLMLKSSVDIPSLRDNLEWRYPDIAWADCGWRGTTLRIELVQGIPMGETATHIGSGDVIAQRDGIVESIITLAGTDLVEPGDVVHKGQVLIQGVERTAEDGQVPVMARGQVYARVWDSASVRMDVHEMQTSYTGQEYVCWTINGPWFRLWRIPGKIYEDEDIRRAEMPLGGLFFPLSILVETHLETELNTAARNLDEIKTEASEAALRLLRQRTGNHDDLVDKWVDYCMIEDEEVEAVAIGERIIDIATPLRHEP